MAVIGQFSKTENGYKGFIKTLYLDLPEVILSAHEKDEFTSEKAPDYGITVKNTRIGAGWRQAKAVFGDELVRISIDDPSMDRTIYASLMKAGKSSETFNLVWSRGRKK